MIKVGFLGIGFPMTKAVVHELREAMIRLAEKEKEIEFWFHGCHDSFDQKAVQFILEIKAVLPASKIDIVAISDPVKNERFDLPEFNESKEGFPPKSVTRVVLSPRIEGRSELHENRFVEHSRKVDRWYMEQCDIIFAYHYDIVPNYVNTEIKRLKKRNKPEIISVYDKEFAQRLDDFIAHMDDRDGLILQKLRNGSTYRELSDELGITINRVQQIASRATRRMMHFIRYEQK